MSRFDLAHSSIFSGLESELRKLDRVIPLISFDFADSNDWSYVKAVTPYIDIAFLSADKDSEKEIRKLAHLVYTMGPGLVVITRGAQGALAYNGSRYQSQSIIPTEVIDTLGAGDAFIAGFLVAYLKNKDLARALSGGALAASKGCSIWGAFGYGVPIRQGSGNANRLITNKR
jgi:fructoselysine 6-kinase